MKTPLAWLPKHMMGRVVIILALFYIIVLLWIPIAETFYWSFFIREPGQFDYTGLDNYRKLLFD
ncbi:MAG: hypothetical protein AAF629_06665, partial [Chloroflexota bacterium]